MSTPHVSTASLFFWIGNCEREKGRRNCFTKTKAGKTNRVYLRYKEGFRELLSNSTNEDGFHRDTAGHVSVCQCASSRDGDESEVFSHEAVKMMERTCAFV